MADKIYKLIFTKDDGSEDVVQFTAPQGEPGEPGKTPIKGTDYFTDADKQEIAEQAAELVEIPDVDLTGYATEEYVRNKIAEAELGGEEVDLSGYAQKSELPTKVSQLENDKGYLTEHQSLTDYAKKTDIPTVPTKVSAFENDNGYLTEHQDISGKLDASALPTAINTALAQAKTSGEFDGKDGKDGYTPQKNVDYFDGKDGSNGKDGVSATHSWNGTVLTVTSASGTSSADLKGAKGDKGDKGDSIKGDKGDTGAAGTSVTVKSVSESTADGGSNVVTFSDGKTVTIKNGSKGSTGSNGSNGVSATHSWNGTTLTVTSASGTSSANLKGEKGDKGDKGDTGATGAAYTLTAEDKAEMVDAVQAAMDDMPDYVIAEAESVIDRVVVAQGNNTFTIAAITDMHYGNSSYTDGVEHACEALKYIDSRIKLDSVAVLGDYTDGYPATGLDNAIGDFRSINVVLDALRFTPNIRIQGNHDYYANNTPIIHRYIQAYSEYVVWGNKIGGYFYKDIDAFKLRIICVNTTETDNANIACSLDQYNWFINSLDMSAKEDASEWQILILSHHPLDWYVSDSIYRFGNILWAYKNGTSWSGGNVSCDFAGKNSATVIANIHGHIHNLLTSGIYRNTGNTAAGNAGIYRMTTPEACVGRENQYDGVWKEDTSYPKVKGTAGETAFCIYCIDLDAKTIKAICYGAGYDRTIDYTTGVQQIKYSVTNNLTNVTTDNSVASVDAGSAYTANLTPTGSSIDSVVVTMGGEEITSSVYANGVITISSVTGNIVITAVGEAKIEIINLLDAVGYKDNTRFSASNGAEKTETGCVATGYIDINGMTNADKYYAWGAEFNNANAGGKCVFVAYDANKVVKAQGYIEANGRNSGLTMTFDSANRLVISMHGVSEEIPRYIRFSGVGSGANVFVTKNQLPS